jgi:hypothetical protein
MPDNITLALFKDVLDPSVNPDLDVAVQAFHIRRPVFPALEACNPITSRFLNHVGHCVERLFITVDKPYTFATFSMWGVFFRQVNVTQTRKQMNQ